MKGLLSKLMPLDRAVKLAMRFGLLKAPLEFAVKAWDKAQGVRTQASMVLSVAVAAAAFFNLITWEQAEPLLQVLLGVAGATFAEKVKRAIPAAKKVSAKVAEEAAKRKKST